MLHPCLQLRTKKRISTPSRNTLVEIPALEAKPKKEVVTAHTAVSHKPVSTEMAVFWYKKLKDNTANQDQYTQSMYAD
jgi:hypothetical protein